MRLFSVNLGGGGSSTIVVADVGDLPASGDLGQFALTTDDNLVYIWDGSSWVLVGGQGNLLGHSGAAAIADAQQTVSVVFASAMPDTTYALNCSITNVTDADPIYLNIVSTTKLTTGFTVEFNAPTDTANYILEWQVTRAI